MKYTVRLEFDVNSIDFGDVIVEASSPEEAKEKAIEVYYNGMDIDYYSSNSYDSTLKEEDSDYWLIEEL
jgi:hypothetical protein